MREEGRLEMEDHWVLGSLLQDHVAQQRLVQGGISKVQPLGSLLAAATSVW